MYGDEIITYYCDIKEFEGSLVNARALYAVFFLLTMQTMWAMAITRISAGDNLDKVDMVPSLFVG